MLACRGGEGGAAAQWRCRRRDLRGRQMRGGWRWAVPQAAVTCAADWGDLAAIRGYDDGEMRLWDWKQSKKMVGAGRGVGGGVRSGASGGAGGRDFFSVPFVGSGGKLFYGARGVVVNGCFFFLLCFSCREEINTFYIYLVKFKKFY